MSESNLALSHQSSIPSSDSAQHRRDYAGDEADLVDDVDDMEGVRAEVPSVSSSPRWTIANFWNWKPQIEQAARDRPNEAPALIKRVLQVALETGDAACQALAAWIAGNAWFWLDNPERALSYFEQAEAIYVKLDEPLNIARLSVGKANALNDLSRFDLALDTANRWLAVLSDSPDPQDQQRWANLHNARGIACDHLGRYLEAIDGYQHKLNWWRRQSGPGAEVQVARARVNLGVVKTRLGQYADALAEFGAAREGIAAHADSPADWRDIARIDFNVAWLEAMRHSNSALVSAAFVRAHESAQRAHGVDGADEAIPDLAMLDLLEAEWRIQHHATDQIDIAAMQQLRERCRANALQYEVARADLILAHCAVFQQRYSQAAEAYAALADAPIAQQDADIASSAELGLARVCRHGQEVDAAIAHYERAIQHIERVRGKIAVDDFRAGYFEDKLAAYRELTQVWLQVQSTQAAFRMAEMSKARTLAEAIADAAPKPAPALAAPAPASPSSSTSPRSLDELDDGSAPLIPSIETLSGQLPAGMLAIDFTIAGDRVWAFLLNAHGWVCDPIELGPPPDGEALRGQLERIALMGKLPAKLAAQFTAQHTRSAQQVLGDWYAQYLAPLQAHLDQHRVLLISPDGLLNLLPFSALFNAGVGRYLVETHEITLTPSLGVWSLIQGRLRPLSAPAALLGYSSSGRLRQAQTEAAQFAELLRQSGWVHTSDDITLLLEEQATCTALARASARARLLYLATHAVCRPDAPAHSYLELADGRLELADILRLALDAALVVLSACETGSGALSGNELIGLVRAFILAGANNVIATHWRVTDDATQALMQVFNQNLCRGADSAAALRQAQLDFVGRGGGSAPSAQTHPEWAHPYYWGGISSFGGLAGFGKAGAPSQLREY